MFIEAELQFVLARQKTVSVRSKKIAIVKASFHMMWVMLSQPRNVLQGNKDAIETDFDVEVPLCGGLLHFCPPSDRSPIHDPHQIPSSRRV